MDEIDLGGGGGSRPYCAKGIRGRGLLDTEKKWCRKSGVYSACCCYLLCTLPLPGSERSTLCPFVLPASLTGTLPVISMATVFSVRAAQTPPPQEGLP